MGEARPVYRTLEIGRFLAASAVFAAHLLPAMEARVRPGASLFANIHPPAALGVEYFFTLSGFIMVTVHRRDFGRLAAIPRFWWRRALRIYPVYWLALALPLALFWRQQSPLHLLQLITLQPLNVPDLVPTAWSLRNELCFYFMFSLLMLPRAALPVLLVWIAGVLWACWWRAPFGLDHLLPPYPAFLARPGVGELFDWQTMFFFGGLIGGWIHPRLRWGARGTLWFTAAATAGLVVALGFGGWGVLWGRPFVRFEEGLGFALVMAGLCRLESLGVLRCPRWARFAGLLSYPLYILHADVLLLLGLMLGARRFSAPAVYGLTLATAAAAYMVAAAATRWLDQPLQRRLRRIRF